MVALAVATALCLPMIPGRPVYYLDWQNHLYLVAKQASYVAEHLAPTFFLNTVDRGWFYPFYAFYGGTLYYLVGLVGVGLHSVWAAYVGSYLVAMAAAFAGWTWLSRQGGLERWAAYLPGLVYVSGAYYLTNAYGRGAWPEFVATSAMPPAIAASWRILTSDRLTPSGVVVLTASVVILTGSHVITLLLSLPFVAGVLALGIALRRPLAVRPVRLVVVLGIVTIAIGLNAWFLLPLIAYRGTLDAQVIEHGARLFSLARDFNRLDVIFSLIPRNPYAWSTPQLYVQAPVVPLLAALATLGIAVRSVRGRRLIPLSAGVFAGFASILVLITVDAIWDALPPGANVVQFPYRLNTYLLACISGLVLVAGRSVSGLGDARPPLSAALLGGLTVSVAVQFGLAQHQIWTASTYGRADRVLADLTRLPESFYDNNYFNASARVIANPHTAVRASAAGLDVSAVEMAVPANGSAQIVRTNVVLSPLIAFDPPRIAGRADGYAVLDVPRSASPTRFVARTAQTFETVVGGFVTLMSALASIGVVGLVLARRRAQTSR